MMGIRAAWREDLKATAAKLVFRKPIRLPGQFLEESPMNTPDTIIGKLRKTIQRLRPTIKRHGKNLTFIFKEMSKAQKVFVRQDAPTGTLQPPYEGPYEKQRAKKPLK